MNTLSENLVIVCERLKKFRVLYEQNEMAVREQIINPILKSIGWDPENPEHVRPNVTTDEGVPDYSLITHDKTAVFLEAKKLDVDIEKKEVMNQLAKYSFGEGTKYGVLTNGAIWILIRSFEEGTTLKERIVWKADLENEEILSISRKMATISRNNVDKIELLVKKAQILNEIWQSLIEEPGEIVKSLMPVVKSTIAQGYPGYSFEDAEIEDLLKERIKEMVTGPSDALLTDENELSPSWAAEGKPRRMKLSGDTFEIRNSFEVLVNTANWLIRKGKLKGSDCPIGMGHKRNLVNTQPKHKYGDAFRAPKKLSNGLWIETHYSTATCISNARRLLERFHYSSNTLEID